MFAREGSSGVKARRHSKKYARKHGKPEGGPVTLNLDGNMLNSMIAKRGNNAKKVEVNIGFSSVESARKARIHNELGSSTSRVKRRFLFLNKKEWIKVVNGAMREIGMIRRTRGTHRHT